MVSTHINRISCYFFGETHPVIILLSPLTHCLPTTHLLFRENQMLQMKQSNIQSRKWTDDSDIANCSSCIKQFGITVRKHHCRQCGGVFCADCTENTANVPSFKKPQRVCEICFNELKNAWFLVEYRYSNFTQDRSLRLEMTEAFRFD